MPKQLTGEIRFFFSLSAGEAEFLFLPSARADWFLPLWSSWPDTESAISGTAVDLQMDKYYPESKHLLFFFSLPRLQSLASSRSKLLRPETQTYSEVRKKSRKHTMHICFSFLFFLTSWRIQTRVVKDCKPPWLNPFCMVQNFNQSYYSSSQSL